MAIELNLAGTAAPTAGNKKPAAKIWLNVGYTSVDPTTGESTFISLPLGIPLDTMEMKPVTGTNEDYKQLLQAKNALLEMLQTVSAQVDSGGEEIIADLEVQMRRVATVDVPSVGDNPHLSALKGLSFASKAA